MLTNIDARNIASLVETVNSSSPALHRLYLGRSYDFDGSRPSGRGIRPCFISWSTRHMCLHPPAGARWSQSGRYMIR